MVRVWSMATEQSESGESAVLEGLIIYMPLCAGPLHQPSAQAQPPVPTQLQSPLSLPPDNDSGYEASPSSATRLASFRFGSLTDSTIDPTLDEELLAFDLPIMLYDTEGLADNTVDEIEDQQMVDGYSEDPNNNSMRAESQNSGGSNGSERLISTPIPIPTISRNSLTQTSHLTERSGMSSPLSLSHTNMSFGANSYRFVSHYEEEEGFGREMFARHHWHRYHIEIEAISPRSPPTYWSPYITGMVSPVRQSYHNNHNHYETQPPLSYAQDIRLPSPLTSMSFGSQISSNSMSEWPQDGNNRNSAHNNQPLPDVVNVEMRVRSSNGHNQARRAVSVSLPIDAETIRSVGMSLRRISDDFGRSQMMLSERGSDGRAGNMLALLSRRSLSARFRSHYRQLNGRPRSYSTNDTPEE